MHLVCYLYVLYKKIAFSAQWHSRKELLPRDHLLYICFARPVHIRKKQQQQFDCEGLVHQQQHGSSNNTSIARGWCKMVLEGLVQDGFRHPDILKISKIATGRKHGQNLWRALRNLKAENPLRRAIIKFRNRSLLISMILISEGGGGRGSRGDDSHRDDQKMIPR